MAKLFHLAETILVDTPHTSSNRRESFNFNKVYIIWYESYNTEEGERAKPVQNCLKSILTILNNTVVLMCKRCVCFKWSLKDRFSKGYRTFTFAFLNGKANLLVWIVFIVGRIRRMPPDRSDSGRLDFKSCLLLHPTGKIERRG